MAARRGGRGTAGGEEKKLSGVCWVSRLEFQSQDLGLEVKVRVHTLRKGSGTTTGNEGNAVASWEFPAWGLH